MKATLKFYLPEDDSLFEEYQQGLKLYYFMHQWLQNTKWQIENGISAQDLINDLHTGLHEENINIV